MAKKLPGIPVYNAAEVTWVSDVSPAIGSVEHSDLTRHLVPGQKWMTRIYEDACDIGFMMVGRRTLLFTLNDTIENANGDEVVSWLFCNDETGIQVQVWND